MAFKKFDRSKLNILPLEQRIHDVKLEDVLLKIDGEIPEYDHPALDVLADAIVKARRDHDATVLMMYGAHVIRTGNGLFTGILTGRLLGDGSLIPCVICFFNSAAIGTGAPMLAVIDFRPCAEAVIAFDIDGQRIDRSGDGTVIVTGIHIGGDGGVADGGTALDTEGKGEDLTGNGGTFREGKGTGAAGKAGQSRTAEGTFAADKLKDTAVVNKHECCGPAVLYLGNADGEINGVATACAGLGSTDGHGCGAGGKDGTDHG